jgi:hypothetical protein
MEKSLAFLLEQACPSIQYRLRKEVLNQAPQSSEMSDLQSKIMEDGLVREVSGWQGDDGWLAWDFHGYKSTEAGIRILCEKGVESGQPVLAKALVSLEEHSDRLERGIGKVGHILDQTGLGGSETIRAGLFAYAGIEDKPFIHEQIRIALAAIEAVPAVNSLKDLVEEYRGKLILRKGMVWPSIYHLRLLAWTRGWRTSENQWMVSKSIRRLVELSPIPAYNVLHHSQLMAPASFCMDDFNPDLNRLDDAHWMMWFHRMELLARLGVIHRIPALEKQLNALKQILAANDGMFNKKLVHLYFRKWGAYTGLMLESDWKTPARRENDLTFRSLLIIHYSELYKGEAPGKMAISS